MQHSPPDVKFLLNQRRGAKFVILSVLWTSTAVHSESKWACKRDCSPEDSGEYWDVCFICVGTHDRTLNDINHHYQITMNKHKNWTWKLNINIYNYCISCLSKKFLPAGGSWISFISPGRWIGNEQLFKVGHIERSPKFLEYALILISLSILHKFTFL